MTRKEIADELCKRLTKLRAALSWDGSVEHLHGMWQAKKVIREWAREKSKT